ncbi:helix-turn-helix transcriptional regulator [Polyangium aurulentum]|uniref:helix-turn-helix transcriptional regulator n=1 Tax=Polyangium aurulentum TaxID=2567896 RepID=UPI0020101754|nr:AraC family transcriptional regulator [Polyangium aurulentum]UQA54917.1 AraC family transcriptional regulator [Polyangium aurulentum]
MGSSNRWRGRLFMGRDRLVYAGPVGSTQPHAHHAFQVVLALEQTMLLGPGGEEPAPVSLAIIPPDAPHAIHVPCPFVLLVFIDPDGAAGRRLRELGVPHTPAAAWRQIAEARLLDLALCEPQTWAEADSLAAEIVERLAPGAARPRPMHPAITRVLRCLPDLLDGPVRLEELAALAGISAGRLSHLFTETVGIPLRPYVRWLRLQRAAQSLERGASITATAHAAGFADAAHLNRVFRRMFGIAPSDIVGWAEWIAPPSE